jgi:hypothetical protein
MPHHKKARRHHIVSQCYLKGFTREGRKTSTLYVIGIQTGRKFPTVPAKVGLWRDFNRVDTEPSVDVEQWLSRIESDVASALRRIESAQSLSDSRDWQSVLRLAALFLVRTPDNREMIRKASERLFELLADVLLSSESQYERDLDIARRDGFISAAPTLGYLRMREYVARGRYRINVSTARHIAIEFSAWPKAHEALLRRSWMLCLAPTAGGDFVTSDRPLTLVDGNQNPSTPRRPLGLLTSGSLVFFPVTRKCWRLAP